MEIANQFTIARSMNRFPSEIGAVSSLEFLKLEDLMREEYAKAEEDRRQAEREERLRRM